MGLVYLWLVMLCVSSCSPDSLSENLVVLVGTNPSVHLGNTATLPCWLNPPQSVKSVEVRWYRGSEGYDTPVLLYQQGKLVSSSQDASYVGRASFGTKDTTSSGLKTGDVSLKLLDVTLSDAGKYTCFVSGDQFHDSGTLNLIVTATGSNPLLSVVWKENNMVNVSCQSDGWLPEPVMQWSDQKGNLAVENVVYRKDSLGLHSVHGWVFVPSNSQVSCTVGLQNEEAKEAKFHLGNPEKQEQTDYGWVAFGLLCGALAIVFAVFGVLYFKKRKKSKRKTIEDPPEGQPLMSEVNDPVVPQQYNESAFNKIYRNIKLEDSGNENVIIKDLLLRDKTGNIPEGQNVTCLTAVRGTSGFSSGEHYWEVSLQKSLGVPLKESWWVGVTSVSEIPHDAEFLPNTTNGFWFLSSSRDSVFQVNTEPKFSLSISVRPSKVGVYLNRDSGELSFYNVNDGSLIGSLTATFKKEVFPIFNPGIGDTSPMEILHRGEQTQENNDTVNEDEAKEKEVV